MERIEKQLEQYDAAYHAAAPNFDNNLDGTDHSKVILPGDVDSFNDQRSKAERDKTDDGFVPLDIEIDSLPATEALYLGRTLLMQDRATMVYTPVVITKKIDAHAHTKPGEASKVDYYLSRIGQPFVPEIGVTKGIHLGVSLAAQTLSGEFGGHGDGGHKRDTEKQDAAKHTGNKVHDAANTHAIHNKTIKQQELAKPKKMSFEQGHISAPILGAVDEALAKQIVLGGHKKTGEIINQGVAAQMSGGRVLDIAQQKPIKLPVGAGHTMTVYWHPKLEKDGIPIMGDMPEATRLMLGGALGKIGTAGQERVRQLIEDAVREQKVHGNIHSH
jgi:hypothetical protein